MVMIVVKKSKFSGRSVMASYSAGSLRKVCTTCNNGVILQNSCRKKLRLIAWKLEFNCVFIYLFAHIFWWLWEFYSRCISEFGDLRKALVRTQTLVFDCADVGLKERQQFTFGRQLSRWEFTCELATSFCTNKLLRNDRVVE